MKIWIRSIYDNCSDFAKPEEFVNVCSIREPHIFGPDVPVPICRKHMARLLCGSGKRLPKHGTDEVVEVELTARVKWK